MNTATSTVILPSPQTYETRWLWADRWVLTMFSIIVFSLLTACVWACARVHECECPTALMWLSFTVSDQASAANKQIRNDIYWSAGKREKNTSPFKELRHGCHWNSGPGRAPCRHLWFLSQYIRYEQGKMQHFHVFYKIFEDTPKDTFQCYRGKIARKNGHCAGIATYKNRQKRG